MQQSGILSIVSVPLDDQAALLHRMDELEQRLASKHMSFPAIGNRPVLVSLEGGQESWMV